MGVRPRSRPTHLAAKLLAIRQYLRLSQSEMNSRLGFDLSPARISEYEHGNREPNLLTLFRYAQIIRVHMEKLVDDSIDVDQFHFELEEKLKLRSRK